MASEELAAIVADPDGAGVDTGAVGGYDRSRPDRPGRVRSTIRGIGPWLPLMLVAFALYTWRVDTNPPGFYLDEASISYNAYTISVDGRDEHDKAWPLFFQTWDPSVAVNPAYVYLLALVFKIFGPSILAARLLSATVGFAAAVLLGIVAGRATGRAWVAWIVAGSALTMPWLFQVSRLVFEVSLFPLVLVLVLLVIQRIHARPRWSPWGIVALGGLLGLLTYTYTIGRLLGPLFAFGLIVFASRARARSIFATWMVFGITLLPALAFNVANSGALSARADLLGYIRPGMSVIDIGATFLNHLLANVDPRQMLLLGDPNIRHHVPVMGSVLVATFALALIGVDRIVHGGYRDPWTRYVVYGLLASLVPASLTIDDFHTLRLIAFPVFLLLVTAIGIGSLAGRTGWRGYVVPGLVVLTAAQALVFQVQFWRFGPDRGGAFDAAFPGVFRAALAAGASPIYLRDRGDLPGYIEAYWYGTLIGLDRSSFVRLRSDEIPPAGAIVLGTDTNCGACEVLAREGDYIAFRAAASTGAGLIPNSDFEAIGSTQLEAFGAQIYGWSASPDTALFADGARTDGAHLVLRHVSDTTTTKQTDSATVAITPGASLLLHGFVRAGRSNQSPARATIALVELGADHRFVTWHPQTVDLDPSTDWQEEHLGPIQLDPRTAFVSVSWYLEPGGSVGDEVEIDDITVDYAR
ncbi:MAG: hypothetical protein HY262_03485 [Chloroflexi bacterium]|nr:hypothetical protein [Chloroflexota bacterium]